MSLAVLKRKTKATYKTKKGTFSLNGTQRNLSYVGKNYAGMTRNSYCFTNSKSIKKSVGNQNTVIRNRTEFSKKDINIESLVNSEGETVDIYVSPTVADNIETITESSQVNVVSSNGNKYVFNGGSSYNENLQYGLYNGSYTFASISQSHPLAILNNGKTDLISYTGVESQVLTKDVNGISYNFYYGDIQVEVSGDFGEVSVWCYYHGAMGGENLLTYATPHYRFYTDSGGSNELSPHLTLNLNNTYVFHRVQDDYVDQHPFYLSNVASYQEPSTDINVSGDGSASDGITGNESFTITFTDNMTVNSQLYYFCTNQAHNMINTFALILEGTCTNLPRTGTFQTICNNWVQRVEPDGNVSQAEYIKNKRILATTTQDTSKKQSGAVRCDSNGKPCISTYVDTSKEVMKSSDYNSIAISKRASICRGWQKPFPYVVSAGDTKCIKRYSQASDVINTYYKGACDETIGCNNTV
jgi:hypothetical protein